MFTLRGRLIFLMLFLYVLIAISLFVISQQSQKALIDEINDNIEDLTKAIQISVQNLTSENLDSQNQVEELVKKFRKKGVTEVSILSDDREILASSNPKKVGKRIDKNINTDFLIKAELGSKSLNEKIKEINLPIIIGDEKYGYVNLVLHLDTYTEIQKKHFRMRLIITLGIFLIGTILIIILATQYVKPINKLVESTIKVSNGDLVPIQMSGLNATPEIRLLVNNFNDMIIKIKERFELEKQLEEMSHLYKVGQLSSAIAHEIKNPLNFINLAINQVKDELKEKNYDPNLINMLKMVEDEVKRISDLLVNFLEYGKPIKLEWQRCSIREIMDSLYKIVNLKMQDSDIKLLFDIPEEIIFNCDREKLMGSLLNLLINSVESIGKKGEIKVRAYREGNSVFIEVLDNGKGIPDSIKERIFEPYVSTKATGMGLGLAFTRRIIEEHGGKIYLDDKYKDGAKFVIELPYE
ncbi:sensor histidine kinase [Calditerrivibrio nitroreducens]|uniref:histidine kinase n=1 Tax=Calditerrivibrio nitroreducens (strain DSM 19672 / NBRC 101217 / Yu37-1) TaxID=768670 RepID=E4TJK9_CALNY|nr:ATP-binding protein [Calditerrivibrio nitroreducens]ADR18171.1 integral membrane sensor signal transduction histidine kinase [Calditerrivibrio nitroreducens DSM 19672]